MKTSSSIVRDILEDRERGAARLLAEYRDRLFCDALALCGEKSAAEDLVFKTFERVLDKIEDTGWLIDGPNIPGRPFWVMRHRTPLLT